MMVSTVQAPTERDISWKAQGYASLAQTDTGLHMRQRSRAFIVADASSPSNRILFINAGKHRNRDYSQPTSLTASHRYSDGRYRRPAFHRLPTLNSIPGRLHQREHCLRRNPSTLRCWRLLGKSPPPSHRTGLRQSGSRRYHRWHCPRGPESPRKSGAWEAQCGEYDGVKREYQSIAVSVFG